MSVLAAEVERREPAPVLDVRVGLGLAEEGRGLAEALPRGLMEGGVAVLKQTNMGTVQSSLVTKKD